MKTTELPILAARLNELAEYYERKPPGAAALRIWLDVLGECRLDDAQFVLTDWPKTHRAMPLADEVLKACRGRLSDRIEAEAERNRRTAGTVGEVVASLARNPTPQAQIARQELQAWMRESRHLTRDPKAWARKLRDRENAGELLSEAQQKAWRAALRTWIHNEFNFLARSIGQRFRRLREEREKSTAIGDWESIDSAYRARALRGEP